MTGKARMKTNYPGVFFRIAERKGKSGEERVYYIVFKQDGKVIEEKVGRQYADDMTPARASGIRAERIEGKRVSRKEIREAVLAAKAAEVTKPTIARLWDQYQQSFDDGKARKADISRYHIYIKSLFENKTPNEITTLDADKLRHKLLKMGKSPQTAKHVLALLRRIVRFGVKKGLCAATDPSKLHFEMPKVDNQKTESLTADQLKKYLEAIDREPDQDAAAFLRLALITGMRKGALMALQWADIDFESGFILLRGEVAKKGTTERIPLSHAARAVLRGVKKTDSPFVFPGKNGAQRKDFRKIAIRVKQRAGLPENFRPLHGLRHAYASFLASSGKVDLYTLQKLLTHSSPQMTQRYAHLADEAMQRAARVADEIFIATTDNKQGHNG
ncbi:tyrosine-type recombinase/integrase [Desulfovibrio intestinalis]|uniref:Integrase n=1 Tax=Desulfovibrio intestinalis TaxID=58621 RepID=A0A7W8FF80_9BACT|nr:site-specific integrase [Desulfovibrio intestinalis]MBB5143643.1 integrase [Desulfovibrio intestinalis]